MALAKMYIATEWVDYLLVANDVTANTFTEQCEWEYFRHRLRYRSLCVNVPLGCKKDYRLRT